MTASRMGEKKKKDVMVFVPLRCRGTNAVLLADRRGAPEEKSKKEDGLGYIAASAVSL